MLLAICILLVSLINVQSRPFLQRNQIPETTNCLTSVISNSCESHGAVTIKNKFMCEKATSLFLGRPIKTAHVHKSLRWHSPTGCHHNHIQTYFNKRTKQFYNKEGKIQRGQGQCTHHTPCICLSMNEQCPEKHSFLPFHHVENNRNKN